MRTTLKSIFENNVIFLTHNTSFSNFVLNTSQIDDSHELRRFLLIIYYIPSFIVLGFKLLDHKLHDFMRHVSKSFDFIEKQLDKIFLIGLSLFFLANVRNRHQFVLVVFIHKIGKPFLFSDPFRVLVVLGLSEVNSFSKGVFVTLFAHILIFVVDGMQFTAIGNVILFDLIVDDGQQVQSFLHFIYIRFIALLGNTITIPYHSC